MAHNTYSVANAALQHKFLNPHTGYRMILVSPNHNTNQARALSTAMPFATGAAA
jgi:hypothetical protein